MAGISRLSGDHEKGIRLHQGSASPYDKLLKRPVTIRLDEPTIDYFRTLAADTAIPYQALINLYLRDYAATKRKPALNWRLASSR
jgi:uncharacterized protein (DUF4415 family)